MIFELWVPGKAIAQGSMRSPKAGVVLHSSASLKAWRQEIGWKAKEAWRGQPLFDCPVRLHADFIFERPQKPRDSGWKDTPPDLDKLIRAVGDALEGVVVKNDSRIAAVTAMKFWTTAARPDPGVWLMVERLGDR